MKSEKVNEFETCPCGLLWVSAESFLYEDRWVLFFGSDDPASLRMVGINCEINSPKSGINRRCAGLFVRDAEGEGGEAPEPHWIRARREKRAHHKAARREGVVED